MGRGDRVDDRRGDGRERLVAPLAVGAPAGGRAAHLAGANPVPGRPRSAGRRTVRQPGHRDHHGRRAVVLRPGRGGAVAAAPVVAPALPVRHHPRHGRRRLDRQPADPARRRRGDDRRRVATAAPHEPAAHQGDGMTAFAATASYELRMQLRKPAIWIATAIPFGLFAVLAMMGTQNMDRLTQDTNPKTWMAESMGWFTPLLAMVFGIVLADRLVRDRKLGVASLLDVTPSNRSARLLGKYLGAC